MSVVPRPWPQPAAEIVAAVAAMYRGRRERPPPVLVRDKLGEWLADDQFAGAYGVRGKPGWPPGRLALVTIFQMAEDLTDRQAAEAVRTRIDWKYALGLGLRARPGPCRGAQLSCYHVFLGWLAPFAASLDKELRKEEAPCGLLGWSLASSSVATGGHAWCSAVYLSATLVK